eukprot:764212-Hanusia_phi.AAC.4
MAQELCYEYHDSPKDKFVTEIKDILRPGRAGAAGPARPGSESPRVSSAASIDSESHSCHDDSLKSPEWIAAGPGVPSHESPRCAAAPGGGSLRPGPGRVPGLRVRVI